MEPASVEAASPRAEGLAREPRGLRERPGHVIPILEREFDDFDTEAGKFLAGETPEDKFIGFRLKQGVYGQRQADVQMIRVKLPFGGVTPEQMEAFADLAEQYTPLRKGHITTRQNFQFHHIPLPDAAKAIRMISRRRPLEPRGLRQHRPQRDRRPVGGRQRGRAVRPHPVRRRVRALLRAQRGLPAAAAQVQGRVHGRPTRTVAITNIHDLGFVPRIREIDGKEVKGFEIRTGGGTSIMPRVGGRSGSSRRSTTAST